MANNIDSISYYLDSELTDASPDSIGGVLQEFGNEMQDALRKELRSSDAYVTGDLANHIEFETKVMGTTVTFQLRLEDYWDYVNQGVNGTRTVRNNTPYSYRSKQPPVSALMRWANDRGIGSPKERKGIAFAMSRSIKEKGLKGNRFYDKVVTEDRLKKLRRDLSKAATKDITTIIAHTATGIFGRIA